MPLAHSWVTWVCIRNLGISIYLQSRMSVCLRIETHDNYLHISHIHRTYNFNLIFSFEIKEILILRIIIKDLHTLFMLLLKR